MGQNAKMFRLLMGLILCAPLVACSGDSEGPPPKAGPETSDQGAAEAAEAEGEAEGKPVYHQLADEQVQPARDLAAIRESGELRVLLQRDDVTEVPREGSPVAVVTAGVEFIASRLGVEPRYVVDASREALRQGMLAGRGDLLVMQLSPHESELKGLAATTVVRHVQEVVVMPKQSGGEKKAPAPAAFKDLKHQQIFAGPWFPSYERLTAKAIVTLLDDASEPEAVLARVGAGEIPLAVAFSEDVGSYLAYRDDIEVAFALSEEVPLVWAVSPAAPRLLEGINGVIFESALTTHTRAAYGGDLEEIKKRKVLRVAMQNDGASYFLFRGQQVGFQYELAARLAKQLKVRLEVVVPDKPGDLARLVSQNRADLAVISMTAELSDPVQLSSPFAFAEQVLVQPASAEPITEVGQLAGKAVCVRRSSSYFQLLSQLAIEGLKLVEAPEELTTEELIAKVGKGEIPLTVSNSVLLGVELTYRDDIAGTLVLAKKSPLAYAMRQDAPKLLAWVNQEVKKGYKGRPFKKLYKKYFKNKKKIRQHLAEEASVSGRLSPYDDLAREFARAHGIDWRLVVAQMYQESKFNPKAKGWAGAIGLMQIPPKTGKKLGVRNKKQLKDPRANVAAGVRYLAELIEKFDPEIPMRQRIRFALASYNAGYGHVVDARQLAGKKGLDPDRWFGNVEEAMRLLEKPKYYRKARHGYCRGSEPVDYVSQIQTRYDGYVALMPAEGFEAGQGSGP